MVAIMAIVVGDQRDERNGPSFFTFQLQNIASPRCFAMGLWAQDMAFISTANFKFSYVSGSLKKLNAAVLWKSKMEGSLARFNQRQSERIFQVAFVIGQDVGIVSDFKKAVRFDFLVVEVDALSVVCEYLSIHFSTSNHDFVLSIEESCFSRAQIKFFRVSQLYF